MIKNKMSFLKVILDENNVPYDNLKIRHMYCDTWSNWRNEFKALRLTTQGFKWLEQYVKFYKIEFPKEIQLPFTNKFLLLMQNYIDCPYFLDDDGVWVSSEQVAVQLILFGGNIEKYCLLREKNRSAVLTSEIKSVL
jgi:hypothetical protein